MLQVAAQNGSDSEWEGLLTLCDVVPAIFTVLSSPSNMTAVLSRLIYF